MVPRGDCLPEWNWGQGQALGITVTLAPASPHQPRAQPPQNPEAQQIPRAAFPSQSPHLLTLQGGVWEAVGGTRSSECLD